MAFFGWLAWRLQRHWKEYGHAWLVVPMLLCYTLVALLTLWMLLALGRLLEILEKPPACSVTASDTYLQYS